MGDLPGAVLFACTMNAVRSPMAEAIMKHFHGHLVFVDSVGVRAAEIDFIKRARARRRSLAVLDIPLLLETGGERFCDAVAVVVAPPFVQARRVLARPGMTPARFAAIRARQMSDREKIRRADFVIPTGLGRAVTLRHFRAIVRMLTGRGETRALRR